MKKLIIVVAFVAAVLGAGWASMAYPTVPNETVSNVYSCNGTQTTFPYTFKLLSVNDLVVTTSAPATLVYSTDYTVTGVGLAAGGNVVLVAGSRCAAAQTITIRRRLASYAQTTSFRTQSFSAAALENTVDKLAQMGIELKGYALTPWEIISSTCAANQWVSAIPGTSVAVCTQPAFTNISGILDPAQLPTTGASAAMLTTGSLSSGLFPTEVTTVTAGSNLSVASATVNEVSKRGGVVTVALNEISATSNGYSWTSLGTIPAGFRPRTSTSFTGFCLSSGGSVYLCTYSISTSGVLSGDYLNDPAGAALAALAGWSKAANDKMRVWTSYVQGN